MKKSLLLITLVSISFVCAAENDGEITPVPGSPVLPAPSRHNTSGNDSNPLTLSDEQREAVNALAAKKPYDAAKLPFRLVTKEMELKAQEAKNAAAIVQLERVYGAAIAGVAQLSCLEDVAKRLTLAKARMVPFEEKKSSAMTDYDTREQQLLAEQIEALKKKLRNLLPTVVVTNTDGVITTEDLQ